MENVFTVTGMACGGCSDRVKKAVSALDGVKSAGVVLEDKKLTVDYDPQTLSKEDIVKAVEKLGFGITAD